MKRMFRFNVASKPDTLLNVNLCTYILYGNRQEDIYRGRNWSYREIRR